MKKIAVLLVFTVMFGVYSPAFAERSWSDVAVDAGAGGVIGAVIGGDLVIITGGAAFGMALLRFTGAGSK